MNRIFWLSLYFILATVLLILGYLPCYPCNLKSIILNVLQGAYASSLVVIIFELIKEVGLYKRLNFLNGIWEECGIENRFLTGKIATGKIKYSGGNALSIELTHDNRTWVGEIIVNKDYPHIGTISWAYLPDSGQDHEFGLKEFIIPTERNKIDKDYYYLYLIPVNYTEGLLGELRKDNSIYLASYGYGKVVWRKKKN